MLVLTMNGLRRNDARPELLHPVPLLQCIIRLKSEGSNSSFIDKKMRSKKEVFQPHLPIRLPCYDLAPVTSFTLGDSLRLSTLGTPSFHGLTGGVYKVRERIHRSIADLRLLAIPAS